MRVNEIKARIPVSFVNDSSVLDDRVCLEDDDDTPEEESRRRSDSRRRHEYIRREIIRNTRRHLTSCFDSTKYERVDPFTSDDDENTPHQSILFACKNSIFFQTFGLLQLVLTRIHTLDGYLLVYVQCTYSLVV